MKKKHNPEIYGHAEVKNSDAVSATDLVGMVGQEGPGSSLKVRAYYLPDGTTKVGFTIWMSDYTNGPAVYFYRDPKTCDSISSILPLGGESIISTVPKINTRIGDKRVVPIISSDPKNTVHTRPIDPTAEEKYLFEILPFDDITPEETRAIHAQTNG